MKEQAEFKKRKDSTKGDSMRMTMMCTLHIYPKQGVGVKESKININQLDNGQGI